jgi:hypothetical protein
VADGALVRTLRWPTGGQAERVRERPALGRGEALRICAEPQLAELMARTVENWGYRVVGPADEAVAAVGTEAALTDVEDCLVRVPLEIPFGTDDLLRALERALR